VIVLVERTNTLTLEDLQTADHDERDHSSAERPGLRYPAAPEQLVSTTSLVKKNRNRHSDKRER